MEKAATFTPSPPRLADTAPGPGLARLLRTMDLASCNGSPLIEGLRAGPRGTGPPAAVDPGIWRTRLRAEPIHRRPVADFLAAPNIRSAYASTISDTTAADRLLIAGPGPW